MVTKSVESGVLIMAKQVEDNGKIPSNVLMCRQWWKVCWMYGDQEKYYRYLYGSRKKTDDYEMDGMKTPKITAAATSTTTTLLTLQQQITTQNNDQ